MNEIDFCVWIVELGLLFYYSYIVLFLIKYMKICFGY